MEVKQLAQQNREVEAWRQYAAWSDTVWQDFPDLSDGAKRAFDLLLRLGLHRRRQDVNAAALAMWMGKTKAARGHEAIEQLVAAGLLEFGKRQRGRYIDCSLCDPLDALGPHRQANHPQGERMLSGIAWYDDATAQSAPAETVRLAAADAPPRPPAPLDPPTGEAPDLATHEAPDLAKSKAPDLATSRADSQKHGVSEQSARFGPKSGAAPTCTCMEDLSSNLNLETLVGAQVQVDPRGAPDLASAEFGPNSGASPLATIGGVLAQLVARLADRRGLRLAIELAEVVPGLWGDWAELLAGELDGTRDADHGGEPTPLTVALLASLIVDSRRAVAQGRASKSLAVYFTGTVNKWLSRHGRKRIYVEKRKPRPR